MITKRLHLTLIPATVAVACLWLTPGCQSAPSTEPTPESETSTETSQRGDASATDASNKTNTAKGSPDLLGRTGCIEGDCKNGEGVYVYDTGDVYRGRFQNGKREGKGIFEYANGDRYEGNFTENNRTGFGSYTFANGDKYVGEFNNGNLKGIGTYRFADGTQLKGTFGGNGATGEGILVEKEMSNNEKGRDCTVENRLLFCRN